MIGFALEGGGAKGSFQVGAVQALYEMGIYPDVVVGSSIGAINGAFIASGKINELVKLWSESEIEDMIDANSERLRAVLKFDIKNDYADIRRFVLDTLKSGGLDVSPLKNTLKMEISEETLRQSQIDFGLVTVSLSDLKPIEAFVEDIPEGMLLDYIMASANFPAFKIEKVEDKKLLDGGFFDNLPINLLLSRGCDKIYAIRLFGVGRFRKVSNEELVPIEYITPSEDLGHTLGISSKQAKRNIRLGYLDAMRVLKKMKSTLYYITDVPDEHEMFQRLLALDDHVLEVMEHVFDTRKIPKRMLFEDLIPLLGNYLGLKSDATYGQLILGFYETIAQYLEVERLEIYTFEAFIETIKCAYRDSFLSNDEKQRQFKTNWVNFIPSKTRSLMSKKLKLQLILQMYQALYEESQTL